MCFVNDCRGALDKENCHRTFFGFFFPAASSCCLSEGSAEAKMPFPKIPVRAFPGTLQGAPREKEGGG